MRAECLPYLQDPNTGEPLELSQGIVWNAKSGVQYRVRNGIPIFLNDVVGSNRKYQAMYDRLAPGYDIAERLYNWIFRKPDYRLEYISELEVKPQAVILEVSVGTGANIRYFEEDVDFFGVDLSWGMLARCKRNLKSAQRDAELFQGEAERLPFRDSVFDTVFHVGGINFFNDRAAAIREMIRVAKPGTKLLIVDETEKVVTEMYGKNPLTHKYFKGQGKEAYCPIDLIPAEMTEVASRQIAGGKLYCLTFRKP